MAEPIVNPDDDFGRLSLFMPIKVVNGFVTCDFVLGCYCCKFCLNRRYPDWQRLLEAGKVYRNTLQIEKAAELLLRIKAFTKGKVTLKIGHDTDMSLEEEEAQRLVGLLPPDHPTVFMRRGKLLPEYRDFYLRPRRNLLVELTLTPRSEYLEYATDPFPILESFAGVPQVFYTVAPVCGDNIEEAIELIRAVPKGSLMWVKELIVKDIPGYSEASRALDDERIEALRRLAEETGHKVVSYLNCVVRAEVGLPFHKRGEFVSEPNAWQLKWSESCKVRSLCGRDVPENEAMRRIREALDELGLELLEPPRKFGHKSYEVFVREDVNFGDECYVREITGLKVDLYKHGRKTGTALSPDIASRWREFDFFPVDEVAELAKESFAIAMGRKYGG